MNSSCETAIEHMPQCQEVVGLNPTWCWAFSPMIICVVRSCYRCIGICSGKVWQRFGTLRYLVAQ